LLQVGIASDVYSTGVSERVAIKEVLRIHRKLAIKDICTNALLIKVMLINAVNVELVAVKRTG
jgi:hypothetical protein